MLRAILVSATLLSVGCVSSRAARPDAPPVWYELRTPHFTIATTRSLDGARLTALELEQFRSAILQVLWPEAPELAGTLDVVVFRDNAQLWEFAPQQVRGYFAPGLTGRLMVLSNQREISAVAHELTHYVGSFAVPRQPLWLVEGLATFMEAAQVFPRGDVEIGEPSSDRLRAAQRHRVPMATLWKWRGGDCDGESVFDFYATSWLVVHALTNRYPDGFHAFLARLAAGEEPRAAFAAALPGLTDEQLDHVLAEHAKAGRYAVVRVPSRVKDTPIQERTLSAVEVHLQRARLWVTAIGFERADAAQRAFDEVEEALRLEPKNADALIFRQRLAPDPARAQGLVESLPNDPRAWKLLADTLKAKPARQAEALDRAIALDTRDIEVLHARALLFNEAGTPQLALPLVERAAKLEPYTRNAQLALYFVHLALRNCTEARDALVRSIQLLPEDTPQGFRDDRNVDLLNFEAMCNPAPIPPRPDLR